jgi:hypothetical protein
MISCSLNGKKYTMDFVTGRALREIDDAADMYRRLVQITTDASEGKDMSGETLTVREAMDVMVKWFCLLFNNQFTPDDMYDYYPADRIMHDISTAILAVQTQATDVLSEFPTKPAAEKTKARG